MQAPFTSIAVFGPGLLGGSIARSIRERIPECDLRLWARREQPLELARQQGICDKTYTDPIAAARGAQLIILATPIAGHRPQCHCDRRGLSQGLRTPHHGGYTY